MNNPNAIKRMESIRIGDIMIQLADYPKVNPEQTLKEAIHIMKDSRLVIAGETSLPRVLLAIDDQGRLRGSVRRRDIMRGLEPKFLVTQPLNYRKKLFDVSVDPNLSEMSHEKLVEGIKKQAEMKVKKVMRPLNIYVDFDDHIIKGIYECVGYGITLLPVLKDKQVVGIVRSVELFRELAKIVN
ncbi:MAG: CBS domain-containing protein [Deltaproteobacteria bacterium]|nr:CBS domain-containing protein [Deltaproteobacteria bacterium]